MKQHVKTLLDSVQPVLGEMRRGEVWTIRNAVRIAVRQMFAEHAAETTKHVALVSFIRADAERSTTASVTLIMATLAKLLAEERWLGDRTAQFYALYSDASSLESAVMSALIAQEIGAILRNSPGAFTRNSMPLNMQAVRRNIGVEYLNLMRALEDYAVLHNLVSTTAKPTVLNKARTRKSTHDTQH